MTSNNVHLIMPMAGNGSRFTKLGIACPKPLIKIQGKPFFFWAAKSIPNFREITFIVLKEHVEKFSIDKEILTYFPTAKIIQLPKVLNGAVLTAMKGVEQITDNCAIVINDCDHAFISQSYRDFLEKGDKTVDGGLLTFKSHEPRFSYVKYDSNKKVIGTVEKITVSDDAICGAYYFRNKDIFLKFTEKYLSNCIYDEFFISGVYNEMCDLGLLVKKFDTDLHLSFGTPSEFDIIKNSPKFKEIIT